MSIVTLKSNSQVSTNYAILTKLKLQGLQGADFREEPGLCDVLRYKEAYNYKTKH